MLKINGKEVRTIVIDGEIKIVVDNEFQTSFTKNGTWVNPKNKMEYRL